MQKKVSIASLCLIVNVLLLFVALSPEFVTFAEVAPRNVAVNDIVSAAAAGRAQILDLLRSHHAELFALATANFVLVLWALKTGKSQ